MSNIYSVWDFMRRHKIIVTLVFFAVLVGFVDEDSYWNRYHMWRQLDELRAQKQVYEDKYNEDSHKLNALKNDPHEAERVAREKYLMKRDGEDVYVFVNADANYTDSLKTK